MVAGYFGDTTEMLQILSDIDIDAVAVDLVAGSVPAGDVQLGDKLLVAEIVDGRNIWRTDPDVARETLNRLPARGPVAVSSSCSLLHVPYTLAAEQHLDPQLRSWLAFADKKVAEDVALSKALSATDIDADRAIVAARAAAEDRAALPGSSSSRCEPGSPNSTTAPSAGCGGRHRHHPGGRAGVRRTVAAQAIRLAELSGLGPHSRRSPSCSIGRC